jgi:hypothetical protein
MAKALGFQNPRILECVMRYSVITRQLTDGQSGLLKTTRVTITSSPIHVTPRLHFSRFLRATQTCWHKQVDFKAAQM